MSQKNSDFRFVIFRIFWFFFLDFLNFPNFQNFLNFQKNEFTIASICFICVVLEPFLFKVFTSWLLFCRKSELIKTKCMHEKGQWKPHEKYHEKCQKMHDVQICPYVKYFVCSNSLWSLMSLLLVALWTRYPSFVKNQNCDIYCFRVDSGPLSRK